MLLKNTYIFYFIIQRLIRLFPVINWMKNQNIKKLGSGDQNPKLPEKIVNFETYIKKK